MEAQTEYNKTTTNMQMLMDVFGKCHRKLIQNNKKSNPFLMSFDRIEERIIEERAEFYEAYDRWKNNPTPENLEAMQLEISDIVNFYAMFSAKAEGYTELDRQC